jgi:hypothetical protein
VTFSCLWLHVSCIGDPDYGQHRVGVVYKWLLGGLSILQQLLKIRFVVSFSIVVMVFVEKLYLQNMCLLCKQLLTLCNF